MVVLKISEPILEDGVIHVATDWQVANDMIFENIVLESMNNIDDLLDITFTDVMDPDIKYYARSRIRLSTGYTGWSNLDAFTPYDTYTGSIVLDIPTIISPPNIDTDSDYDNHMPTLFNITATGFNVIGDASHIATTWIILDLDHNIVWISEYDTLNRESIFIDDIILKKNQVYIIKAMYHSSSNDSSQFGSKIVYISNVTEIDITSRLYNVAIDIDYTLILNYNCNIVKTYCTIYEKTSNGLYHIIDLESTNTLEHEIVIPSGTLKDDTLYLLKVNIRKTDDSLSDYLYEELSTY